MYLMYLLEYSWHQLLKYVDISYKNKNKQKKPYQHKSLGFVDQCVNYVSIMR